MTDFGTATTIGGRIQALRRARGMRTSKELADAIGGTMTVSIIENIELGRKSNLDVAQLLSIAMALQVPPSYVLAPMNDPGAPLDLPGLSPAFDGMTAIQFDAWLSSLEHGAHNPTTLDGRTMRFELAALREWSAATAEIRRLEVMHELEQSEGVGEYARATSQRIAETRREADRLAAMLNAGGWALPTHEERKEEIA
jgi:transcriptional regulator with XRE-family HTH domain